MQKNIPHRLTRVLEIIKIIKHPSSTKKGGWEMVIDPAEILELEKEFKRKFRLIRQAKKTIEPRDEEALAGVFGEDQFYIHTRMFFRRPVLKEPSEKEVVLYNIMYWKGQVYGNSGVTLLVVNEKGEFVLNRSWRPTIQSWLLETPGTITRRGESALQTVRRCVQNETGLKILKITKLADDYIPERGIMGGTVPLFLVKVSNQTGEGSDSAVVGTVALTKKQVEKIICQGSFNFQDKKYLCHDGHFLSSYLIAEKRGLI